MNSMGPLSLFSGCEVGSLVRSNAVWNTMVADKVFCKSMDGSVGRSIITCWKQKSIIRISIHSRRTKGCPLCEGNGPMYSTCHQACWLVTPEKGVISEDQRQSPSLADQHWAFSSSCSQASLGEWMSMWSHPHITSIRATTALCSWAHWAWQGRLEKGYPQNRTVHPIIFITEHICWSVTF